MQCRNTLVLSAITAFGLAWLSGNAIAQQKSLKEQLTGAWLHVSEENTAPDGTKRTFFGADDKGVMIFDASGQYAQILVRSDVPKFKANSRLQGTAEENAAVVRGTTATFGTWTVDEASKTVIVRFVGSLFPNQIGAESKRSVSVSGDELKMHVPVIAAGGSDDTVWRRAK
jgi:hypothetical protein